MQKRPTSLVDAAGLPLFESDQIQIPHYFDEQGYAGCRCFTIVLKDKEFYAVDGDTALPLFPLFFQFQVFKVQTLKEANDGI